VRVDALVERPRPHVVGIDRDVVGVVEGAHLLVHLRGLGGDLPALAVDVGLVAVEHRLAVPEVAVARLADGQVARDVDRDGLHIDRHGHSGDGGARIARLRQGGGRRGERGDRKGEGQSHG